MEVPRIARTCPNDGTDLLLREGQVFADKYELLSVVGSGAMGIIYKARHLILDKIVAIKVLHSPSADANLIMRFQREAKAASSLSHINVITVYDFGVHDGAAPYMVMDYLHGKTLAEYIEARGQLSLRETLDIAEQVLSALAHAQKKNILHRDLKPSNIMVLEEDGEPRLIKLLDFGLAKLLDRDDQVTLSAMGSALGSPAYMSPEQATGLKVDTRSDLYSLGCIIFEMLTGQPPLLGDSPMETLMNRLNKRVPPVRQFIIDSIRTRSYNPLQEVPTIVELFVAKLLERDQRDRFQTAQDARNYLNTIWEYVDTPDPENLLQTRPSRASKSSSGRITVKDIPVSDVSREWKESQERLAKPDSKDATSTGSHPKVKARHQSPKAVEPASESRNHRRSQTGLRRITIEQEKTTPAITPRAGQDGKVDFGQLINDLERIANMVVDLTHQFRRSNPGLYQVAVALAIISLIVVVLIMR